MRGGWWLVGGGYILGMRASGVWLPFHGSWTGSRDHGLGHIRFSAGAIGLRELLLSLCDHSLGEWEPSDVDNILADFGPKSSIAARSERNESKVAARGLGRFGSHEPEFPWTPQVNCNF